MSSYYDAISNRAILESATSVNTTAHDTILNGSTHESLVRLLVSVKTV